MIKKRFFTISKKGEYHDNIVLFRFENLEGSIEMFKYLMQGKAIKLDTISVPNNAKPPDNDGWVWDVNLFVEAGEEEYHLGSEIVEVYTKEEAEKIKKERQEWKDSFKKKKGK